jgi:hypothetical protein
LTTSYPSGAYSRSENSHRKNGDCSFGF